MHDANNMNSRLCILTLFAFIAFNSSGCMTIADAISGPKTYDDKCFSGPQIYGGIQLDVKGIVSESDHHVPFLTTLLFIIDLPLSLCLDTAILPVSLINELIISDANSKDNTNE